MRARARSGILCPKLLSPGPPVPWIVTDRLQGTDERICSKMNVICPKCSRTMTVPAGNPVLKCSTCNMVIDRLDLGVSPGLSSLSLERDLRNETVGLYKITELIGSGTTGVAFKARRKSGGEPVVLKILGYNYLRKNDFIERLRTQAKGMARLDHPNIARTLDLGRQGDLYYVVTEFVEGVTLGHYMKSFELDFDEVRHIMAQVCSAVAHAHREGILHRNIKPSNIMMGQGSVKVLDFGHAPLVFGENQRPPVSRTISFLESFNYMSPEERTGHDPVTESSDIFSLGVLTYELLTGRLPVGAYYLPSQARAGLPAHWDRIVQQCLNAVPEERYDMVEDIEADLTMTNRAYKLKRKNRVRLLLLLLAGLSLFVLLWFRWPNHTAGVKTGSTSGSGRESPPIGAYFSAAGPGSGPAAGPFASTG